MRPEQVILNKRGRIRRAFDAEDEAAIEQLFEEAKPHGTTAIRDLLLAVEAEIDYIKSNLGSDCYVELGTQLRKTLSDGYISTQLVRLIREIK